MPQGLDVVLVDSGSTDNTVKIAKSAGYKVMPAAWGRGQGSGVRTGMEYFLKGGYESLILLDFDYSDDPREIPKVLESLTRGGYDYVVGVRDFKKQRMHLGLTSIFVKRLVSLLILVLTGYRLKDMLTGVWAFKRHAIEEIYPKLTERGFEYGFEIVYVSWLLNLKPGEVDVDFRQRLGKTKLTITQRFIQVYYGVKFGIKILTTKLAGEKNQTI
jgi:dolichol-phosphate mannosyltransferase